ncbi:MAG: carbamoyltransferase HypF [candidate division WOR-3 bacterium]
MRTLSILVKGQVQGIGFRPFIYNLAKKLHLKGMVKNTKSGVLILVQGKNSKKFLDLLNSSPPRLAKIDNVIAKCINLKQYKDFVIEKSEQNLNTHSDSVLIMPDLAICDDCISDILNPNNRRFFYPFTNCTQCGPRYSIIIDTPYDRSRTTMRVFKMCTDCEKEYKNPEDRRFHAQPNACHTCGPQITLNRTNRKTTFKNDLSKKIIENAVALLKQGKILAIKSIGGFLLAVDAQNDKAVQFLRIRKNRPKKPFAVMCKDIKTIKQLCFVNKEEEKLLSSNIAPIVLLKKRPNPKIKISELVAPNNGYLGIMLPYTPLHRLLFETKYVSHETSKSCAQSVKRTVCQPLKVLVMTSANPKDSPIITDAKNIEARLSNCVDYILDHNRKIESRCDDSIVFNYKGQILVRRSRGYVPSPIILQDIKVKPVLSFGSDLKNYFALGNGNKIYLSPYVGDLGSNETIAFFWEMLEKYQRWFGIKPEFVACDLHPDYISHRMAEEYAKSHKLPIIKIQHHFAHLVSVIAEYNLKPPVIGLSFDGTGYGDDSNIWGSEFLILDFITYHRLGHLRYLPLIGGDSAITNPKKIGDAYLRELGISPKRSLSFGLNQINTSSMGRLFDAIAHLLGVCSLQTYEGEAPIGLEAEALKFEPFAKIRLNKKLIEDSIIVATDNFNPLPDTNIAKHLLKKYTIDPKPILEYILKEQKSDKDISRLSWLFHQWVVETSVAVTKRISAQTKISQVCLAGGVFQNKIILKGIVENLEKSGFKVYFNRAVPINDGGIALGQAIIAGKK